MVIRKLQRGQLLLPPSPLLPPRWLRCPGWVGGCSSHPLCRKRGRPRGRARRALSPRVSVRARPRPLGSARSRADSPPPRLGLPPAPPSPAAAAHSAAAQEEQQPAGEPRGDGAALPARPPRTARGSERDPAPLRVTAALSPFAGVRREAKPPPSPLIPPRLPEPPGRGCPQAEAERRGGAASPPPDPKLFSAAPHGAQAGRRGRGRTALRFLSPSLTRRAARGEGLGCRPRSEFSLLPTLHVSGEVGHGGEPSATPPRPAGSSAHRLRLPPSSAAAEVPAPGDRRAARAAAAAARIIKSGKLPPCRRSHGPARELGAAVRRGARPARPPGSRRPR